MPMLQTAAKGFGALCLIVAGFHAFKAHAADAAAQRFRAPGAAARSLLFVPLRWNPELYTEAGQQLVRSAWHHQKLLWLFGLFAAGFLVFSNATF